jgi:predicted SnoaL-like aldol condensation-catalyzing enzyme
MVVAVDIFRVAGGQVAEHWDVLQEEVPPAQTANGHGMFTRLA